MSWASCSPLQFYEMNSLILSRMSLTNSYARSRSEGVVGEKTAVQRQNTLKLSVLGTGTGLVPSRSWLSETSHSGFKMSIDVTPIDYNVPSIGWKVKLDHVFEEKRNQNVKPRWHQVRQLFPLAIRYIFYHINVVFQSRQPLMNYLRQETGKQIYGVPIGGIGSGTIGRGFKGEFCRFQLRPGRYEYNTVPADNFIVTIQNSQGRTLYQKVLCTYGKPKKILSSWEWDFDGSQAEYTALYPRSWTVFRIPDHAVTLICRQISPVTPHNYKDSCLPGAVFVWTILNEGTELLNVSITFTFKNGCGRRDDKDGNCCSNLFESEASRGTKVSGVEISHRMDDMDYTYALAALQKEGVSITRLLRFNPCGTGEEVWGRLSDAGELWEKPELSEPTVSGEQLGAAVCSRVAILPGACVETAFSLIWHMPHVHFTCNKKTYTRYYTTRDYTRVLDTDSQKSYPDVTPELLSSYALENYPLWEDSIDAWQTPILEDTQLPEWYRNAIFNELYYVADGGTIWLKPQSENEYPATDPRREFGLFAYLEGHEYRMYNTYDVHFYASFALAMLWPKLQEVIQYEICDTIGEENKSVRRHLYNGKCQERKVIGTVPHDLGDPEEEPFDLINAYPVHDVSEWKDLNLKFVLQVWRDFTLTRHKQYLTDMWPNCKKVMEVARTWDTDGDGLIENSGSPDQTYDSWVMEGASAYCGGLWLAALYCMKRMATEFNDTEAEKLYGDLLENGKKAFGEKLWNGKYYNFDSSDSPQSRSVMSDQLCGQWYLRSCGVTEEVFPAENVKQALKTIFRLNVMSFCEGRCGAVNGMTPDAEIDISTIQSEEVWVGVVYGLCALMIHEDMEEEAFLTAGGMFNTIYNKIGMGFETPEALYEKNHYRAIGYMRPLSIWAMQLAWQLRQKSKEENNWKPRGSFR